MSLDDKPMVGIVGSVYDETMIETIIEEVVKAGGRDIHFVPGEKPAVRIHGEIKTLREYPALTHHDTLLMPEAVGLDRERLKTLEERRWISYPRYFGRGADGRGKYRVRVNISYQRNSMQWVFRVIPFEIPSVATLGIPQLVVSALDSPSGLLVVAGGRGDGKTTTVAALVDAINGSRQKRIVTIEEGIEFVHRHKLSVVTQREIPRDVLSFESGLREAEEQDSDVVVVSAIRMPEVLDRVLEIAESGTLVIAIVNASRVTTALEKMFSLCGGKNGYAQIARVLRAVLVQKLFKIDNESLSRIKGRVLGCEVLMGGPQGRQAVRTGNLRTVYNMMSVGCEGSVTLEDAHKRLEEQGLNVRGEFEGHGLSEEGERRGW